MITQVLMPVPGIHLIPYKYQIRTVISYSYSSTSPVLAAFNATNMIVMAFSILIRIPQQPQILASLCISLYEALTLWIWGTDTKAWCLLSEMLD